MFIFECYENSPIKYYDEYTNLCFKALCGSRSWLVVVKSIKKTQS